MLRRRNFQGSKDKGFRVSLIFILVMLLWIPLHSAGADSAPQQTGAVPLSQGIADLASQLAKGIPQGHTMTIAVTDFPDRRKQVCGLGQFVAERLGTLLSRQPQCRLIERRRLDVVLGELKFSMSELVDPAKARRLGEMLGVQGLVVGTVTDLGATFDVDARIIDIQTDVSLPGASASIVKDEAVKSLISDCQGTAGLDASGSATRGDGRSPSESRGASQVPAQSVTVKDITFEVLSCALGGTKLNCTLAITNGGPDAQLTAYAGKTQNPPAVRVVDDLGNECGSDSVQLGGSTTRLDGRVWDSVIATFVSGVPMTARLTFEDVSSAASALSLLEIPFEVRAMDSHGGFASYTPGLKAQIRNIPITRGTKRPHPEP
ncbi:MAG: FlgO family outer membrane protein [Terriglobia bacterium]|jgi:TolB-like protein